MNDKPQPPPNVPLKVAQRIHETCKHFESAWSGPARPQLATFLADVLEPERSWLLVELLGLEVELRRGAGEQPAEAEYRQSFPGDADGNIIAAAFRRCADSESEPEPSSPAEVSTNEAQALRPNRHDKATNVRPGNKRAGSSIGGPGKPTVEGYEILGVLGRGGMGVVYKARDLRLKRLVALKMILAGEHAGADHLARFRTEAEMVARLQHPNIVQIFDVGEQDGHPYIAFEFIDGRTLADFAAREPHPPGVAAELLEAMARAMQYAHQQGIVHRDLKPANILLASEALSSSSGSSSRTELIPFHGSGRHVTATELVPKIMDFGLAKDLAATLEHTSTGTILGTPNYMSPEQAEGRRDIGPASDVYSLGAILYGLLTGRPPFQGTSAIETLKMVVSADPVAPTQLQPRLAKDLETICLKCLHKDPARRYETAGTLADDLRRFLNDEPIQARASGRIEKTWRWSRRNPSIAVLMASVLLVLVAGVMVSSFFAYTASEEAKLARQAEDYARKREQAETAARKDADTQRERAETGIAESLLDQGLAHCENHDVTRGLLTMVRALEKAPPSANAVKEAIRLNLAFWQGQVGVLKKSRHYQSSVTAAAFAPDGKTYLTGDWGNHQNVLGPPYLIVDDALTGAEVGDKIKDHTKAIWRVAYSPDGKRFASASFDGTARVWDAATRKPVGQPMHHLGAVFSLAFSPDSKRLLTGSNKPGKDPNEIIGLLRVWDAESGAADGESVTQPGIVRTVAWSGDGKLWASGSAELDAKTQQTRGGEIRFWDAETHKAHGEPLRQTDPVGAVAFQPERGLLASGTEDGVVRFWDPATGRRTGKLLQHRDPVTSLVFSRDGQLLLTGSGENRPGRDKGGEARLWNAHTGQLAVQPLVHLAKVNDVALSPDQHTIVAAGDDGNLSVWQVGGSITPDYILRQPELYRTFLRRDGGAVITLSKKDERSEIVVQHWEARTGRGLGKPFLHPYTLLITDAKKLGNRHQGLTDIVGRPDGRWAAFAEWLEVLAQKEQRGPWVFWDTVTRSPVPIPDEVRNSYTVAFSRDSKRFAASRHLPNGESECRAWDVERWQPLGRPILVKSPVLSLLFTADGQSLLTGSEDGVVRSWRVSVGELLSVSEKLTGVPKLELSPDGTRVLTGSVGLPGGSFSQLWNAASMVPVAPRAQGPLDWLFDLHFVPGGRHYVSYNPVQVWDAAAGQHRRTLNGHEVFERRYAAHPTGAYVALAITPHQVRLWHLDTGKWIGPTMSLPGRIGQLSFSPDGAALYVSCNDGTVRRLPVPAARASALPRLKWDIQMLTQKRLTEDGSLLGKNAGGEESEVKGLHTVLPTSEKEAQTWRYTTEKPAENWFKSDVAVSQWKEGPGGFGTKGGPHGTARTEFKSADIWLRRNFELKEAPAGELFLRLFNHNDAEIYLNGVLAAKVASLADYHATVPISEAARKSLRAGKNTLAIHCRQLGNSDQYIDVGLVEWLPEAQK